MWFGRGFLGFFVRTVDVLVTLVLVLLVRDHGAVVNVVLAVLPLGATSVFGSVLVAAHIRDFQGWLSSQLTENWGVSSWLIATKPFGRFRISKEKERKISRDRDRLHHPNSLSCSCRRSAKKKRNGTTMCYCNGLPAHFFRGVHPTWIHLVTHCPRPGCHGVILNPQCDGLGQAMFGNHIGNPAVSIPPKVVARVAGGAANYPTLAAVLAELQAVATIATAVEARSWVDRLLAAAAIDDGISEFEANWKRDQFYLSEGRLEHLLDIPLSPDGYRHFFFEVLSCPKGPLWDRTADRYWAYSDALTDCESDGVFKITGSPILGINPFRPQGCRRSDPEGTSEDCHRLEAADYLCGSRVSTGVPVLRDSSLLIPWS